MVGAALQQVWEGGTTTKKGEMTSGEEEQRGRKRKMEEAGTREGGIAS